VNSHLRQNEAFVSDAYQPCPQANEHLADRMRRHLARNAGAGMIDMLRAGSTPTV
jgi:hypothetical protein